MDPLSIVASTIAIVDVISSAYKAIRHLRGLPDEFKEVNQNLPLVQNTLNLARDHLTEQRLDDSSTDAMRPVLSSCEEKAKMLKEIFERVEREAKDSKDRSVLELYRTSLLRLGKAHRVETLMEGIMKGLDLLASNHLFTVSLIQREELKEAAEKLANIKSSVPDSEFENGGNVQNIASGGTGNQSNVYGLDHKVNSGSGNFYNADTMNFGTK